MNTTSAVPASAAKPPVPTRQAGTGREADAAADGDPVAMFADLISRADAQRDAAAPSRESPAQPDEGAPRSPSADDVVAGAAAPPISPAPAPHAARATGTDPGADGARAPGPRAEPPGERIEGAGAALADRAARGKAAGAAAAHDRADTAALVDADTATPVTDTAAGGSEKLRDRLPAGMTADAAMAAAGTSRDARTLRGARASDPQAASARPDAETAAPSRPPAVPAAAALAAATVPAAPPETAGRDGSRPSGARRGALESQPAAGRGRAAATDRDPAGWTQAATSPATRGTDAATAADPRDPELPRIAHGSGSAGADAGTFNLALSQATAASTETGALPEPAARLHHAAIDVPIDHDGFAEAFAQQSASLVVQGSRHAEIRLTPLEMGPIRVAISLDADAASIDIAADHRDTRAAIEASMPALRQMLADQGVRLSDWRIGSDAADRRQSTGGDAATAFGSPGGGNAGHPGHGGAHGTATAGFARDAHGVGAAGGRGEAGGHAARFDPAMAPAGRAAPRGGGRVDLFA